jgi:3-oxoacyl-[acyl-carrier-protein] synthase-3
MKRSTAVGVHGIGVFLPETVRTNDWWSPEVVAKWGNTHNGRLDRPPEGPQELETEGGRLVMEAMKRYREDPFKGSRARRVMAPEMQTSDMEMRAAQHALTEAGLTPKDVDLFLSTTSLPDYLMVPNACKVHEKMGMNPRCFTLQTEGVCNAFLMQLALAEQMIASGQARYGLLVQSSCMSRLTRPDDPMSAWFGDAATAVVVGPVSEGRGVLGRAHMTDGSLYGGVVCGVPGKHWYEDGAVQGYVADPTLARRLLTSNIHDSQALIRAALADADVAPETVDFYGSHQGFVWLREVTQTLAGIAQAKTVDTYSWAASVLGCNIPLALYTAQKEGILRSGDTTVLFSGAAGSVLSSLVVGWGR